MNCGVISAQDTRHSGLRLAAFDFDATPVSGSQVNSKLMVKSWDMSLRAKGIVLLGSYQPVVLIAIDWRGINNDSQDVFRSALANTAETIPERICY